MNSVRSISHTASLIQPCENGLNSYSSCVSSEKLKIKEEILSLQLLKQKETLYVSYAPGSIFSCVYNKLFCALSFLESELKVSQQTKLVALSYFCRLVEVVSFPVSLYSPYLFTCVMIAYKYEENCEGAMSVADIVVFPNRYCRSISEYNEMERDILSVLRWKLGSVTAAHFLSSYCSSVYLSCLLPKLHFRVSVFVSYCTFFLDLLSSLYEYRQYTSSLQADACFLAACHALNLRYVKGKGDS